MDSNENKDINNINEKINEEKTYSSPPNSWWRRFTTQVSSFFKKIFANIKKIFVKKDKNDSIKNETKINDKPKSDVPSQPKNTNDITKSLENKKEKSSFLDTILSYMFASKLDIEEKRSENPNDIIVSMPKHDETFPITSTENADKPEGHTTSDQSESTDKSTRIPTEVSTEETPDTPEETVDTSTPVPSTEVPNSEEISEELTEDSTENTTIPDQPQSTQEPTIQPTDKLNTEELSSEDPSSEEPTEDKTSPDYPTVESADEPIKVFFDALPNAPKEKINNSDIKATINVTDTNTQTIVEDSERTPPVIVTQDEYIKKVVDKNEPSSPSITNDKKSDDKLQNNKFNNKEEFINAIIKLLSEEEQEKIRIDKSSPHIIKIALSHTNENGKTFVNDIHIDIQKQIICKYSRDLKIKDENKATLTLIKNEELTPSLKNVQQFLNKNQEYIQKEFPNPSIKETEKNSFFDKLKTKSKEWSKQILHIIDIIVDEVPKEQEKQSVDINDILIEETSIKEQPNPQTATPKTSIISKFTDNRLTAGDEVLDEESEIASTTQNNITKNQKLNTPEQLQDEFCI